MEKLRVQEYHPRLVSACWSLWVADSNRARLIHLDPMHCANSWAEAIAIPQLRPRCRILPRVANLRSETVSPHHNEVEIVSHPRRHHPVLDSDVTNVAVQVTTSRCLRDRSWHIPIASCRRNRCRRSCYHEDRDRRRLPRLDECQHRLPTFTIILSLFLNTLQLSILIVAVLVIIIGNACIAVRNARIPSAKVDQVLHYGTVYPGSSSNHAYCIVVEPKTGQDLCGDCPQIANMQIFGCQFPHNVACIVDIDTSVL